MPSRKKKKRKRREEKSAASWRGKEKKLRHMKKKNMGLSLWRGFEMWGFSATKSCSYHILESDIIVFDTKAARRYIAKKS